MKYLTIFLITFLYACAGTKENSEDYSDIYMYDDFYKSNNNQPYRKKSSNGKYILGSYYGDVRTDRDKGFTQVHDAQTQQKMYEIPIFSPANYTFISNDGQKVVCINPNVENDNLIKFYKQGKVFKIYNFKMLLGRERYGMEQYWIYNDKEYYKIDNNVYSMGDTLYVLTKKEHLILFDINSGEIIKGIYVKDDIKKIKTLPYKNPYEPLIEKNTHYQLPNLADGSIYWQKTIPKINIKTYRRSDYRDTPVFTETTDAELEELYARLEIFMTINKDGICENVEIKPKGNVLYFPKLAPQITKLKEFIKQCKFEKNKTPFDLDNWTFYDEFYLKY